MSLVPTYVACRDGNYYKDPVLYGKHGVHEWFICWDDDEPTEFVISNTTIAHCHDVAKTILDNEKIDFLNLNRGRISKRVFPPYWAKYKSAIALYLDLKDPIPVPLIHEGIWDGKPLDGVIYSYGNPFPT